MAAAQGIYGKRVSGQGKIADARPPVLPAHGELGSSLRLRQVEKRGRQQHSDIKAQRGVIRPGTKKGFKTFIDSRPLIK